AGECGGWRGGEGQGGGGGGDCDAERAGLGPSERDERWEILRRQLGMADQQARHGRNHSDRCEVGDRIVRQLGIKRGVDGVANKSDKKGRTVGMRFCDYGGGEVAAGPGITDYRPHPLLRVRRYRPCRRGTNERDELATPHVPLRSKVAAYHVLDMSRDMRIAEKQAARLPLWV